MDDREPSARRPRRITLPLMLTVGGMIILGITTTTLGLLLWPDFDERDRRMLERSQRLDPSMPPMAPRAAEPAAATTPDPPLTADADTGDQPMIDAGVDDAPGSAVPGR